MNIARNIISGQVTGDTAKQLSERFGRILQERESRSLNSGDASISRSSQLDSAIPPSTIAALNSGEFVGMVADDPSEKIELKNFHAEIINKHEAIKGKEAAYRPIPKVRDITSAEIEENYLQIKEEVMTIVESEMERIYDTPELAHLLVAKKIMTVANGNR